MCAQLSHIFLDIAGLVIDFGTRYPEYVRGRCTEYLASADHVGEAGADVLHLQASEADNGDLYSPCVTINGGRIISVSNAALRLCCNSTTNDNAATINGGYFEAVYYALQIRSLNAYANKGTVVINDGEFEATATEYNCSVCCNANNSEAVSLTVNGGKFNDHIATKAGNNAIYGGLFKYDTYTDDGTEYKLSDYVASGYAVAPNDDPNTQTEYPWTVKESEL